MKVRILLCSLFSISLLVPFACDEEKIASVEGTWIGTKAEGEVLVFGVPSGFEEVDDTFSPVLELKPGGIVTLTEHSSLSRSGTWSQHGEKLETNIGFQTNFVQLSGMYTIQRLAEKNLVLYFEKDGTFTDPDTGIKIEGTLKASLTFQKK